MKNRDYILYLDMDEVISDFNGGYSMVGIQWNAMPFP